MTQRFGRGSCSVCIVLSRADPGVVNPMGYCHGLGRILSGRLSRSARGHPHPFESFAVHAVCVLFCQGRANTVILALWIQRAISMVLVAFSLAGCLVAPESILILSNHLRSIIIPSLSWHCPGLGLSACCRLATCTPNFILVVKVITEAVSVQPRVPCSLQSTQRLSSSRKTYPLGT